LCRYRHAQHAVHGAVYAAYIRALALWQVSATPLVGAALTSGNQSEQVVSIVLKLTRHGHRREMWP
jgi:hypothetical protein